MSKYKTGLYYKTCKYSAEPDWISGQQPGGKGHLTAAICINKAIQEVDIAIDPEENNGHMLREAFHQLNIGFESLGIDKAAQNRYKLLYQTPRGTTLIPLVKGPKRRGFLGRLLSSLGLGKP